MLPVDLSGQPMLTRYSCPICMAPNLTLADKKKHMRARHSKKAKS